MRRIAIAAAIALLAVVVARVGPDGRAATPVEAQQPPATQERERRPPVRLAFLGDSLTYGLTASSEDRMYREILTRRILAPAGGEVVATVFQDPYGMTDDALRKVYPVIESRPDVIILEIGNHEAFAGYDQVELFEGRYDLLLGYLQLTGASVIAGTLAWLNYPIDSREYRHALELNQIIRDLCARRGIAVADLWTPTLFRLDLISQPGDPSAFPDLEGDDLHPNDAGHQVLADAFWDAYRRDLARRRLAALP